jgi:ferredoxin-thioredoxin reductase catalytic chain
MRSARTDEERIRTSVTRMVNEYAKRSPFFLNPDSVVVKNIIDGLTRNKMKYGYAYCPCREVTSVPEKDKDNICPCQTHKEDIARQGTCECGLFADEAYLNAKKR